MQGAPLAAPQQGVIMEYLIAAVLFATLAVPFLFLVFKGH